MSIERIRTLIDKEWAEVFKNRSVLYTLFFMPLMLTILPIGVLFMLRAASGGGGDSTDMPASFAATCQGLAALDCMQIYVTNQFLLLFMLMPTTIPVAIAAYSIVGEKTTHSLEPLLATPISTAELLLAKGLAAVVPAISSYAGVPSSKRSGTLLADGSSLSGASVSSSAGDAASTPQCGPQNLYGEHA